ncbi:hypothetical protein M3P05_05380 [Sansalvadorimonas sp. 2012CJ34-2]|uniref:Uncharacterized protein n=1 Tax=Parendozoicomonas callyspongiae TaxID=2942213 RepID=A0ABT0PF34_9GAMM|nr:hypothetical protein [Sansalvadorimonas sp. 2012CJ34-2]MCL6269377.1 hypothetical protein [Sansalvadorimonas sp. 2012CJ34-2]
MPKPVGSELHSQGHELPLRQQVEHKKGAGAKVEAKSQVAKSKTVQGKPVQDSRLSDREIENLLADARQESVRVRERQVSESERSDISSSDESGVAGLLAETMDDVSERPAADRKGSDSGFSSGVSSDTESMGGWEDISGERLSKQDKGYLWEKKQHIQGMASSLAVLNNDDLEMCQELWKEVRLYLQDAHELNKDEVLLRTDIVSLRHQLREKLLSMDSLHRGWLVNSSNKNRESMQEFVRGLMLEAFRILPAELQHHIHLADEGTTPEKNITGLLLLSSGVGPQMFPSEDDCQLFRKMCLEEVMDQLAASPSAVATVEKVVDSLGHEQATDCVSALLVLRDALSDEIFSSPQELKDCKKLCWEKALDKIINPQQDIKDLAVADDLLDAIDSDDESRNWGKSLQEMRSQYDQTGQVVICRQCEVDLVRQNMVLKEEGRSVADNAKARANPDSKEEKAAVLASMQQFVQGLEAEQGMQMLSVLNQTLFNSMSSIAEIAVKEKMGQWGVMGIERDNCQHGIEVDKDKDGTVNMKLTLVARPKVLPNLAPSIIVVYEGNSKVQMVRHVTIKPGQDIIISSPKISLNLEQGKVYK